MPLLPRTAICLLAAAGLATTGTGTAAAALTTGFDPDTGTLTITGDGADDTIAISCVTNGVRLNGAVTSPAIACKAESNFLGALVINGGAGKDTIDLTDPSYVKFEYMSWAHPSLKGGTGDDTILGATAANPNPISLYDSIDGGPGNDTIDGGRGGDDITGGAGHNEIDGGDGIDLVYEGADLNAGFGVGSKLSWGVSDWDHLTSVEHLQYTGGASANTINLSAFGNRTTIKGMGGKDTLTGGPSVDIIDGGEGDDTVVGNGDGDSLHGGGGNDTLQGGAGDDDIFTDSGIDTVSGGSEGDNVDLTDAAPGTTANGEGGTDAVSLHGSGSLTDTSFGGLGLTSIEHAQVTGDTVDASAFAGSADLSPATADAGASFTAAAGGGAMHGGGGDDTLRTGPGTDVVKAGNGADTLIEPDLGLGATITSDGYVHGTDKATGIDVLDLTGTAGPDVIDASPFAGSVILRGLGGADTLTGTDKVDTIDVGTGPDLDVVHTRKGADHVLARNGAATTIDCGTGDADTGERDAVDTLSGSCGGIVVPAEPTPTPTPSATPVVTATPTVTPTATTTPTAVIPTVASLKLAPQARQGLRPLHALCRREGACEAAALRAQVQDGEDPDGHAGGRHEVRRPRPPRPRSLPAHGDAAGHRRPHPGRDQAPLICSVIWAGLDGDHIFTGHMRHQVRHTIERISGVGP